MKIQHAAGAAAVLAAALAAPAFATPAVVSSSDSKTVHSASGIAVTPGTPGMTPTTVMVPGATTVMHGPASVTTQGNTTTTVQRYWVNVPRDAVTDDSFQRWQKLK